MRTNNIEDLIREQIIEDLLEEAKGVRIERANTYNNSFLECYNNFGIDYILGEIFNCSERLQILRNESEEISELNWKKIDEVLPDLVNWALLTGVVLKLEKKKLAKTSISEGVVKKSEIEEGSKEENPLLSKLFKLEKDNPNYYDYLMGILKFGPPETFYIRQSHIKYKDDEKLICYNPYKKETKTFYKKCVNYGLQTRYYYIDEEGRIYE